MSLLEFTPPYNPKGKNGLASFAQYYQRLMYKTVVYPHDVWAPLDTWYNKQYYGRVDHLQNSIIPNQGRLKSIKHAAAPNTLALTFIADAFDKFAEHMRNAAIIGVCVKEGTDKILKMKAQRAYEDPMIPYQRFLSTMFESFDQGRDRYSPKIRDFASFAAEYMRFMRHVAQYTPVTLSSYMLTNTVSVFDTGLCIAIDNVEFDGDEYKNETYLQDPNYKFYVRAAKKFGFTVNKNAPWLLTADLFSAAALTQIGYPVDETEPIDKRLFFSDYFVHTYLVDVELLETYIVNCYAEYVRRNPYYEVRTTKEGCDKYQGRIGAEGVTPWRRTDPSPNDKTLLTSKKLSYLYLDLRAAETNDPVPRETLRKSFDEIYYVRPNRNLTGIQNVFAQINFTYRDYIYSKTYPYLNDEFMHLIKKLDESVQTGYHIST